jgi:tetratricopeptide (TPR) repeat protein
MIPLLLLWAQSLTPDDHYARGLQAAQAQQWEQARQEFLAGESEAPLDKRFPIELAGIDYRTGQLSSARRNLQTALRIDPADNYANDFLGTLYFLDNNYEAALKYWNRAGKPRIESLQVIPPPPVSPVLLDRAMAFAPGEILRREQYDSTLAWIRALDSLGNFRPEIEAKPEEKFDVVVRWTPINRWLEAMAGLGGIPVETYRYDVRNLGRHAMTVSALYRWDAQKRWLFASVSAPFENDAHKRYLIYSSARSETWNVGGPQDFRLRKIETGASLRLIPSGRFFWELGGRVADRWYTGTSAFQSGFTAASTAGALYRLVDIPERRLTVDLHGTAELARYFANSRGIYSRARVALEGHWLPAGPSKYDARATIGFGRIFGSAPFDELYSLGLEREDNIALRGYGGTRDGKKGTAPTGTQYVIANIDVFRQIYAMPLATLDAGPLVDVGRMWHQVSGDLEGRVLIDGGLQVRLRLVNGFTFVLSYARAIRGGGGVFDTVLR